MVFNIETDNPNNQNQFQVVVKTSPTDPSVTNYVMNLVSINFFGSYQILALYYWLFRFFGVR